jgi:hypothetical protein
MSRLLAIDPGCSKSAWVLFEGEKPCKWMKEPNEDLMQRMKNTDFDCLDKIVIEMISCNMRAGREIYETCYWIGRYYEASEGLAARMLRVRVKAIVLGSARGNDKMVRAAMIKRYGKIKMAADEWQALALGDAYLRTNGQFCL